MTNPAHSPDNRHSIQALLLLDVVVRLFIWSLSFAITATLMSKFALWPDPAPWHANWSTCWRWGQSFSTAILIFNFAYLAILIALKLPIPATREGRYEMRGNLDRQLMWAGFNAVLTKARLEALFPAILVHQISSLPLIFWVVSRTLGPRSRSCNVTQPILGDPHMITLGRNVVIGYGASIVAHTQDRDGLTIARTIVEDDVLIGAESVIYGGCRISRGATILGGAVVKPFTHLGPNEVWGGVPAVKLKEMPPVT